MRTIILAAVAMLGLAGWHALDAAVALSAQAVQTAYQDAIQRYDGGQTVQRSSAPQRTQPVAGGLDTNAVNNARVAGGANATETDVSAVTQMS